MEAIIRPAAVSGLFYPDSAELLHRQIGDYLSSARTELSPAQPKAMIVPHAGYIYSGPVAGSAFHLLEPFSEIINRVILVGPSHRVAFEGIAASGATHFSTPLGLVPLDRQTTLELEALELVSESDSAHAFEHSLEVQIPFLQEILKDFQLVPLVVGNCSPSQVAKMMETVWGGPETLFVISSDLSHYHDYHTAQKIDKQTASAIENLDPTPIGYENACGRAGLNAILMIAQNRNLEIKELDLRNSGDTAGSKGNVVGYGSWALFEK